jgi:hypothetical protein
MAVSHQALGAEPADVDATIAALVALREPLLAGLDLPRHERFAVWLAAERAAAERLRCSLLHRHVISTAMSPQDRLPWVREWLDADPFNTDAAAQLPRRSGNWGVRMMPR